MRAPGVAVAAVLLAGCSIIAPAGIQTTIPAREGARALPVTVVDGAAIVAGVAPADAAPPEDWSTAEVQAAPGRDDAVVVSWIGGSCDDRAVLTLNPDGNRYVITVESQTSAMACDAVGHFRSVLLVLTVPLDPGAFLVAEPGG